MASGTIVIESQKTADDDHGKPDYVVLKETINKLSKRNDELDSQLADTKQKLVELQSRSSDELEKIRVELERTKRKNESVQGEQHLANLTQTDVTAKLAEAESAVRFYQHLSEQREKRLLDSEAESKRRLEDAQARERRVEIRAKQIVDIERKFDKVKEEMSNTQLRHERLMAKMAKLSDQVERVSMNTNPKHLRRARNNRQSASTIMTKLYHVLDGDDDEEDKGDSPLRF